MSKSNSWAASGCLALLIALTASDALALDCGAFNFPFCSKAGSEPAQFAADFAPKAPFGGFGGGDCRDKVTRTPVVLIHGNGDSAIGWASPGPARRGKPQRPSVYDAMKGQGYNDCELFGITYLDREEQDLGHTADNIHQPKKYEIIWQFIQSVKAYTGSPQVDIVGHSLGVSMSLAALDYYTYTQDENAWASVRRFINIAGGIRGLNSCVLGIAIAATCQGEHTGPADAYYEFGFFPDLSLMWLPHNRWTAVRSERSLRLAPQRQPKVDFYTIFAGRQDDIHCPKALPKYQQVVECTSGPLFAPAKNVRSQINIGADPPADPPDWTTAVDPQIANLFPRDLGGIGHFGARNYAGPIIYQMLTSNCKGATCKGSFVGSFRLGRP